MRKDIMNRKRYSKPELLAPAGDLLRLKTAADYGADAVYIGGQRYSLRSRASNFTHEDIREACRYAGAKGVKVHVTVNEIPHDSDLDGIRDYLCFLQDAGVTAIIAASPYIMKLAKEAAPKLQVHASTQCSVLNSAAAETLVHLTGCERVVLARECSMADVRSIMNRCTADIEVFIHGGMCVNYSGRCTLSNRMTLRDANRGGCAQSCRWHYDLYDGDTCCSEEPLTFGSRDLCAIDSLAELMELGVTSLKIEGRMKTEYYVASIVSALRHMIDEIYDAQQPLSEERMAYYRAEVEAAMNRERWSGFLKNPAGTDSLIRHANSDADVNHSFLGTVLEDRDGWILIETRNPIDRNDRIEVLQPGMENRIFEVETMKNEAGDRLEKSRVPMRKILLSVPFSVKKGALLRKAVV